MPTKPKLLGGRPRWEQDQAYDRRRRLAHPWRDWYALPAWKHRRAEQLAEQPLCERHLRRGKVVAATVANHRTPHRGNWELFISGPLESVCDPCHNGEVQAEERQAARASARRQGAALD